ncbi:nucleotidyltransferase domain-containing protein [Bacillus infantis]|uniref:nucleotidyltransferase domain-containing protein n=1 Tax=Bacillus infantis TaxID=324767 RepID=UPI003CF6193A
MFPECKKAAGWMDGFEKPWFVAGGWAIDLFIGKQTRPHADLEIGIFREDQKALKGQLADWEFRKAVNGSLITWNGEYLKLPVHEIHATDRVHNQQAEILLSEREEGRWIFRRNFDISCPAAEAILFTEDDIPYLNPQIVLLFKLRARTKDQADFQVARDFLSKDQRYWLKRSIQQMDIHHSWISYL